MRFPRRGRRWILLLHLRKSMGENPPRKKLASVAKKAGGGLVRRAMKVLGEVATPLMAGGSSEKPNSN
jgi:hypothetical protein